jgi:hypothetical protein
VLGLPKALEGIFEQADAAAHCQYLVRSLALASPGQLHGPQRLQKFLGFVDFYIHHATRGRAPALGDQDLIDEN